jgi:hypothetical protein
MSDIVRTALGPKLAAYFEVSLAPLPLALVELLARTCVAGAMGEYDRTRPEQTSLTLAVGDL